LETLNKLINIAQVAFGLGFVIFLHELGHFLLAKWNGVKVEKFSIGFGQTIFGFRRGETEYVLAAIPLGGFVKMLGEGPDEEASKSNDPRAYPNKSVWARMAIISAGVIMNVFLGLVCFVYAYGQGMDEIPAKVGAVKPDSPAYLAGLKPGDEIVAVDGRRDISFNSMTLMIRLSGSGEKVHFEVRRPGVPHPHEFEIEPKRAENDDYPTIGVLPAASLNVGEPPFVQPPGMLAPKQDPNKVLKPDDQLVEAGPTELPHTPINDSEELDRRLVDWRAKPLTMVFERKPASEKGNVARERVQIDLPPNHFIDFGLRMSIEPISTVRPGSPAEKVDLRPDDRILKVDGKEDFDPMGLPDYCYERALEDKPVALEFERPGRPRKTLSVDVVPEAAPPAVRLFGDAPLEVPALGLSFGLRTKIASIRPGSPGEKAGLHQGDTIAKMILPPFDTAKKGKPVVIEFGENKSMWPYAFGLIQRMQPQQKAELVVAGSGRSVTIVPEPVGNWYNPDRGLDFQVVIRRLPPMGAIQALQRGTNDTIDNILRMYLTLRSLFQGRVSPKLLGGPLMIAEVAYHQAKTGLTEFIHFLGFLSINLAVLNFLPIPPLDGGQMVFLLAEKVRGRPLPTSAMLIGSYVGIALLICLMVYVMFQDIARLYTG
jgi:regulator of sigma E protease